MRVDTAFMLSSTAAVQRLLGDVHEAWKPREGEAWDAFVRRKASPHAPPFWKPFERADFERALAEAVRRGERRETVRALVLPFWVANNEDEVARDDEWQKVMIVTSEADDALLHEVGLRGDEALWARADVTLVRRSFVTLARSYAPDVAAVTRFGRFAVVDSMLHAVVERIVDSAPVTLTPSPKRLVPGFSAQYVPAFEGGELRAAAERVAAKLSFDGSE